MTSFPDPPAGQPGQPPVPPPGQPYPGQQPLGQQPPGQPYPGQQPLGQPYPGQQPPGQPYPGQPYPGQQPPAAAKKSGAKKWLPVAGTVAVVGGVAAVRFLGFGGDPEVGDCLTMSGDTDYENVDCDAADAEYKIVGIEDEEMTYPDFEDAVAADTVCADFQTWEYALWTGDTETEPGTIYCASPV